METTYRKVSVKDEGDPKEFGYYDTNKGELTYTTNNNIGNHWIDADSITVNPEYYFIKELPAHSKSIEDCLNEVARKDGWKDKNLPTGWNLNSVKEAMQLYFEQGKREEVKGVDVEKRWKDKIEKQDKLHNLNMTPDAKWIMLQLFIQSNTGGFSLEDIRKAYLAGHSERYSKLGDFSDHITTDETGKDYCESLTPKPQDKSDAVEFQIWIAKNDWQLSLDKENCFDKRAGNLIHGIILETKTLSDLYKLFQSEQSKQK